MGPSNNRIAVFATIFVALSSIAYSQTSEIAGELRDPPQPESEPTEPNAAELDVSSISNGCVLLKNDHVLFGQARQLGEYVLVRSRYGGEIRLDREQVACWAPTIRNLYQFRVDHRLAGDLDAHLADARWCLRYDLFDLTAAELRAIYAIDANNAEAKQIEQRLERRVSGDAVTPATNSIAAPNEKVVPVSSNTPTNVRVSDKIEGPSLQQFAGQIQPMLINRCSNCHSHRLAEQTDVQWKIFSPPSGTRASAEFTRTNLEATLPYINTDSPADSPILIYATTTHGGAAAPLGLRNGKAIYGLKRWVQLVSNRLNTTTAATVQEPNQQAINPQAAAFRNPNFQAQNLQGLTQTAKFQADEQNSFRDDGSSIPTAQDPPEDVASSGPARLPIVENPFDPDLFNRRFHMKTTGRP